MNVRFDVLQCPPEEAVRRIALAQLDEARTEVLRLDEPTDAEALHDFRVALRRLRSLLRAWKGELKGSVRGKDRRALAKVQVATGRGRDAEVALEWLASQRPQMAGVHRVGLDWMAERLRARLDEAMAHAREGVREAFDQMDRRLRPRLETLTVTLSLRGNPLHGSPPRATFAAALATAVREHFDALRGLLAGVSSRNEQARLHSARIATKRLRYLVEPVRSQAEAASAVVKQCKSLQDVLGDMNDAHVQTDELGGFLEEAAVERAHRLHELSVAGDDAGLRRASRRSPRSGLVALVQRARQRLEGLHASLESDWLADDLRALAQPVDALVAELEAASRAGREIERKYLLARLPELDESAHSIVIEQGWLPGEAIRERLRRVSCDGRERYFRTIKAGLGLERIEIEEEIDRDLFEGLWPFTEGSRVVKRRFERVDGELTWELDEFLDRNLVLAEVELSHPDQEVSLPDWLGGSLVREVTDEPGYANLNLAR